jgi:hypothetical protein
MVCDQTVGDLPPVGLVKLGVSDVGLSVFEMSLSGIKRGMISQQHIRLFILDFASFLIQGH